MVESPSFLQQAVNNVLKAIKNGQSRILVTIPTKLIAAISQILYEYLPTVTIFESKVLIITDRNRIAEDSQRSLTLTYNDKAVSSIVKDSLSKSPILITTVQAIISPKTGLTQKLMSIDLSLIVFVGCERMGIGRTNTSLGSLVTHFSSIKQIGIDNVHKNSIEYFGSPVFTFSFQEAITQGILVPIKYTNYNLSPSVDEGWTKYELIDDKELLYNSQARRRWPLISDEYTKTITKLIHDGIKNEKTVIFCNTLTDAERVAQILNERADDSDYAVSVTSTKPKEDVSRLLRMFIVEDSPVVLTTVDMLITEESLPNIKHLVILRSIRSTSLLYQILSVGLLPYRNKEYLHVIDCANTLAEFSESRTSIDDLLSKEPNDNIGNTDDITYVNWIQTRFLLRDKTDINGVLGVKDIAEELSHVINKLPNERGSMIGVFGKWGRGKSFLMEEIWQELKKLNDFERVDFHAWKYQDTPATWAYLYEVLSNKYFHPTQEGSFGNKLTEFNRRIKLNLKRNGILAILSFLITVILGVALWYLGEYFSDKPSELKNGIKLFGLSIYGIAVYKMYEHLRKEYSSKAKNLFLKYSKKHSFKEHLGVQAEIQKEIQTLLKAWIPSKLVGKKRIVLFVDDIDRCNEDKIIQLIDSLRVMLEDDVVTNKMIVITAVDERILKYAIRWKYHDLIRQGETINLNMLTKEYIDKLFIIGIKLGELTASEKEEFFMELVKNDYSVKADKLIKNTEKSAILSEKLDAKEKTDEQVLISNDEEDYELSNFDDSEDSNKNMSKDGTKRIDNLLAEEVNTIKTSLKKYLNATPRQIRILYYRYLIAKNLLSKEFLKLMRPNIWAETKYNEIFVDLLIIYSQQEDATLLYQHKTTILNTESTETNLFLIENIVVPTPDYVELLKVFEIVIAY